MLTEHNFDFQLDQKELYILFQNDVCNSYFGNEMVGMGYLIQGLYYVDNISNNNEPQTNVSNDNALL